MVLMENVHQGVVEVFKNDSDIVTVLLLHLVERIVRDSPNMLKFAV